MPEAFDKCRREGGEIRTIKPRDDVYIHICIDKKGKTHAGRVHHVGEKSRSGRSRLVKVHTGPRGGRYVVVDDTTGKKLYLKRSPPTREID